MAILSHSVSTTNNSIANKIRSSYTELKQKVLEKKAQAIIRLAKHEPAEEDQELLPMQVKKKTRMESDDPTTATYLANVRKYKVHRWPADRSRFGRPPYEEVLGF